MDDAANSTSDSLTVAATTASQQLQQLPEGIPPQAYEGQQRALFRQHVLPEILKRGGNADAAWKHFQANSLPGHTTDWPRLNLLATSALEAFTAPISGVGEMLGVPGAEQLRKGVQRDVAKAHEEAGLQGIATGPYEMAGGMVGAAPYFAATMGAAGAMAKSASFGVRALTNFAAGQLTVGAYEAAKADANERVGAAIQGMTSPANLLMMSAGSLAHALHATANVPIEDAKLVAKVATQVSSQAEGAIADVKVAGNPNIVPAMQQAAQDAMAKQTAGAQPIVGVDAQPAQKYYRDVEKQQHSRGDLDLPMTPTDWLDLDPNAPTVNVRPEIATTPPEVVAKSPTTIAGSGVERKAGAVSPPSAPAPLQALQHELESTVSDPTLPTPQRNAARARLQDITALTQQVAANQPPGAMIPITSSTITHVGYDAEGQLLKVRFKQGDVYEHWPVAPDEYQQFMEAPSQGKFYSQTWGKQAGAGRKGQFVKLGFADAPLMDKLETLANGMVRNRETGETFSSFADAIKGGGGTVKYSLAPQPAVMRQGDVVGSADSPLTQHGLNDAKSLAVKFAEKGFGENPLDRIAYGQSMRTRQMAEAQGDATGALMLPQMDHDSWPLGGLEGLPQDEAMPHLQRLVDNPDETPTGTSTFSTANGSSLNKWINQTVPPIFKLAEKAEVTGGRIVLNTHSRILATLDGDPLGESKFGEGSVWRMTPQGLQQVDMNSPGELPGGALYLVRHAESGARTAGGVYTETPLAYVGQGEATRPISAPSNVVGRTQGWTGNKPSVWYAQPDAAMATHELGVHAPILNMGIGDAVRDAMEEHPLTPQLAKVLDKKAYPADIHGEELLAYGTQYFMHGDEEGIQKLVDADGDRATVASWYTDSVKRVLSKVAEQDDSIAKRALQGVLGRASRRAGGLEDAGRDLGHYAATLEMKNGQYVLTAPDGTAKYFNSRESVAKHIDDNFGQPMSTPELVPTESLPQGLPRYAIDDKGGNPMKPAINTDPPDPDLNQRLPKSLLLPSEIEKGWQIPKPGLWNIGLLLRPTMAAVESFAKKFNAPIVATAFRAVNEAEVAMKGALSPWNKAMADAFKDIPFEKRESIFHYVMTTDDQKPTTAVELNLTGSEIAAAHRLIDNVIEPYNKLRGDGFEFRDFAGVFKQRMEDAKGDWHKIKAGASAEAPEGPMTDWARAAEEGEMDPRDQDITRVLPAAINQLLRKQYLEKPLRELAMLGNSTDAKGNFLFGDMQPFIKRYVESFRGMPDRSAKIVQGALNGGIELFNKAISTINKVLPDDHQIDLVDTDANVRDALSRYLAYEYTIGLGLRPGLALRAGVQLLTTTLPVMGSKYMVQGLKATFGEGRTEAFEQARKAGALWDSDPVRDVLAKQEHGMFYNLAKGSMDWTRAAHNGARAVSYHGFLAKVSDALAEYGSRGDWDGFAKAADLDLTGPNYAKAFIGEATRLGDFTGPDASALASRIAKELVGKTQWDYAQANSPGAFRYAIGRVFGQFGLFPLSYIEYWRNLATSGDVATRSVRLSRLVAVHSAVLAAGNASGIDTSGWVFTNPMAFTGSPTLKMLMDFPKALDMSHPEGAQARRDLLKPTYWFDFPGGLQTQLMAHQLAVGDPAQMFIRSLGLTPLRKGSQWHIFDNQ